MKTSRLDTLLVSLAAFVVLFFSLPSAANADTQMYITITTDGYSTDFQTKVRQLPGNCQVTFFYDEYPSTANAGQFQAAGCGSYTAYSPLSVGWSGSGNGDLSGTGWIRILSDAGTTYVVVTNNGGVWSTPADPSEYNESIIYYRLPAQGYVTATTSVDIQMGYFASSTEQYPLDEVILQLLDVTTGYTPVPPPNPAYDGANVYAASSTLGSLMSQVFSFMMDEGHTYAYLIYLRSSENGRTLMASSTDWVTFSVVSDGLTGQLGTGATTTYLLATSTCSLANITGCFQNALVWAFYPSEGAWEFLQSQYAPIKSKPPFGVTAYYTALENVAASSTASSTLVVYDSYMDAIFTPIRTGLATLIAMAFAVWFFKRIREQSHHI